MSAEEYLRIITLALSRLHDEEHFQFMTDMKKLFKATFINYKSGTRSEEVIFTRFVELYSEEDVAIEIIHKSELTEPIAEADAVRGNSFRGLSLYVEAYTHASNKAMAAAADRLKIVFDHYGDVRRKNYNEETASIYNLLQELKDNHSSDIDTIEATDWVSELKQNNVAFENLINNRFDINAGKPKPDLRQIRKDIDETYNNMVKYLEVSNLTSNGALYTDLIKKMNERITYYKNTLAQRKGRSDAKDDEEDLW